jgi:hypothetical protein
MWIMLNSGPVSVVAHNEKPSVLLVRARTREHLESALGSGLSDRVFELKSADYRFRAEVERAECADLTDAIDYGNFKNSVKELGLKQQYLSIWDILAKAYGAYGSKGEG